MQSGKFLESECIAKKLKKSKRSKKSEEKSQNFLSLNIENRVGNAHLFFNAEGRGVKRRGAQRNKRKHKYQ